MAVKKILLISYSCFSTVPFFNYVKNKNAVKTELGLSFAQDGIYTFARYAILYTIQQTSCPLLTSSRC